MAFVALSSVFTSVLVDHGSEKQILSEVELISVNFLLCVTITFQMVPPMQKCSYKS
jgi:hypothetical protein